ncbi:MAG: pantetheine-phosphate adenylyltransferase [Elusimicrobia bacterium]|nr:pantetheine-phosphate adenylyltransferase [Elusimicrobiota bacterium]
MKKRHASTEGLGPAIYPGSFDPLTRGHLDVIQRTSRVFPSVIVAVSHNPSKKHAFSVAERLRMVEDAIRLIPNAQADTYSGLLVDYLKAKKARVLIRGLRVVSDMDYEFQLASMNRRLWSAVETVFLMPDERFAYLSSSMVREVARLGAPVADFVTPFVARELARKFRA